jgi:hypothetical protein
MKQVHAQIYWFTPQMGGRLYLPTGRYSTAARFEDLSHVWPEVAWSVVLDFMTLPDEQQRMNWAKIRFLSPEAPQELLYEGCIFDLFEGQRRVATGMIHIEELAIHPPQ